MAINRTASRLRVVELMRAEMKENDAKRDAGLKVPAGVKRYTDIHYGESEVWNVLDVYRPDECGEKLPVIINIHGGGWIYGDKELYSFYCMSLAERGFAVVNFTYHLAPENRFPIQIEDINKAFCWVQRNAYKYGLDTDNVFITADSAGAHLAGLYLCILTNPEYAAEYELKLPVGLNVKAAAFNCGAYDPFKFKEDKELMLAVIPDGEEEKYAPLINVTEHITSHFPAVFLMSCKGDFCYKYFPLMGDVLKANNVLVEERIYGSEEEPLYHVFNCNMKEVAGKKCNDEECEFFRKFL